MRAGQFSPTASFPRTRESVSEPPALALRPRWIPAFAGMTPLIGAMFCLWLGVPS